MDDLRLRDAAEITYRITRFYTGMLQVVSTCPLEEEIENCLFETLRLFEKALRAQGLQALDDHVCLVFTDRDAFAFSFAQVNTMGHYFPAILLPLHRWRQRRFRPEDIMVIIMEELCHWYFRIQDESLVKDKVTEIFCHHDPGLTRQTLYRRFHDPDRPSRA